MGKMLAKAKERILRLLFDSFNFPGHPQPPWKWFTGHPIVFGLKLTAQFFKPSAGATWCLLFFAVCVRAFLGGDWGINDLCLLG